MYGIPELAGSIFENITDDLPPVWTLDEAFALVQNVGLTRQHLAKLHSQLVGAGYLVRVKRGVYAWPRDPRAFDGEPAAPPGLVANRLAIGSVISHATALVEQGIPIRPGKYSEIVTSAIAGPIVLPAARRSGGSARLRFEDESEDEARAAGERTRQGRRSRPLWERQFWQVASRRYVFVRVKPDRLFGLVRHTVDECWPMAIMRPERAFVACVEHDWLFGSRADMRGMLQPATAHVDPERCVTYARRLNVPRVLGEVKDLLQPRWHERWERELTLIKAVRSHARSAEGATQE